MPNPKVGLLAAPSTAWLVQPGPAQAQNIPAVSCGNAVVVGRGDTLSGVAGRCNVG